MFEEPVTEDIAPGYTEIIDTPMDYLTIERKIEKSEYTTKEQVCNSLRVNVIGREDRERENERERRQWKVH